MLADSYVHPHRYTSSMVARKLPETTVPENIKIIYFQTKANLLRLHLLI